MEKVTFALMIMLTGMISNGFAHEKTYLSIDQVYFEGDRMILDKGCGVAHGISTLRSDSKGLYFLNASDEYWVCPQCGLQNDGGPYKGQICSRCKWPIY
jgi:hypothetical protein